MKMVLISDGVWVNAFAVVALVPARNGEECDIYLSDNGDGGKPIRVGRTTSQVAAAINQYSVH